MTKYNFSWGDAWGDKGYVNMQRGTNGKNLDTCKIATYAHYPEVRILACWVWGTEAKIITHLKLAAHKSQSIKLPNKLHF